MFHPRNHKPQNNPPCCEQFHGGGFFFLLNYTCTMSRKLLVDKMHIIMHDVNISGLVLGIPVVLASLVNWHEDRKSVV